MSGRKAEKKDTYLLFVDTYKVFPTVWLDGLFESLWQAGVRGKMFRVLHNLYDGARRVVSHEGCTTDAFSCDLGLHEGDVISPTLYLFFIDGLLREVSAQHPGVTLLSPMGSSASVVAAMQADDFVAACGSLEEVQAVARTVYAYSCKWRFRLNSSKSAVMHVCASGSTPAAASGIVWNGEEVPVVDKYKYLGLWFQADCGWRYHFEQTLARVEGVKRRLMPLWKSRHVCVDVKRIVLLSLIRPIFEYGSEVWWPSTARQTDLLNKAQTDIVKCAMRCEHENPSTIGVLAEWGLKPLSMWLEQRAMEYLFRVLEMPDHRLPKLVLAADWAIDSCLPWQGRVLDLLARYGIDNCVASGGREACKQHVKQRMAARWGEDVVVNALSSSTLQNYLSYVHPTHLAGRMSFAGPRPFLSGHCRYPSYGVELMMRVRLQCLAVHARTARYGGQRRCNNASEAVSCPACGSVSDGGETLHHLVFDCPAYAMSRTEMFNSIRLSACGGRLDSILRCPDADAKVLRLVSDEWGSEEAATSVSIIVAAYLEKAWGLRNTCKHSKRLYTALDGSAARRGADGEVAMA